MTKKMNSSTPDVIATLLEAAQKEVFRQFTSLLNAVEPRLIILAEETESPLESSRILLLADEFNSDRETMRAASFEMWHQILANFNQSEQDYKAQLKQTGFSLVSDDLLKDEIEIKKLIAQYAHSLNYVLVPIASGFEQACPDAVINQSTIPFFPQSIGDCVQAGLNAADFSDQLDNLIRGMIRDVLLPSLKHLYLGIRKQLEANGYQLEEAAIRKHNNQRSSGSKNTITPSEGQRLIEVPEDLDLDVLELLKNSTLPFDLHNEHQQNRLSVAPADASEDKAIVTISNKDVDNMLATLQAIEPQNQQDSAIDIHQSLADNLEQRSSDTQYNVMSVMGENVINLVALMFEFIQDDSGLPSFVSSTLMRLQIPYMRIALTDTKLFENNDHPARLLLNDLADLGFMADKEESEAYQLVQQTVVSFTDDFEASREKIEEIQTKINAQLLQITQEANEQEQQTEDQARQEAEQEEKLEEANAAAQEFVINPISRIKKTMFFHSLLEKIWVRVVHNIYMNYMPLGDDRSEATDLFEKILWSTGAGETRLFKPDLMRALPEIVKRTTTIFKKCNIDDLLQSHFMEQLQEIHIAFIRNADGKQIKKIDENSLQSISKTKEIVAQLNQQQAQEDEQEQQRIIESKAKKDELAIGHDYKSPAIEETEPSQTETADNQPASKVDLNVAQYEPEKINATDNLTVENNTEETQKADDNSLDFSFSTVTPESVTTEVPADDKRRSMTETLKIVSSVRTNSHMNYMIKGEFKRCKVAFYSPSLEKYIFTDLHGFKLFDRIRAELIVDIQDGYATLINNPVSFDSALASVVTSIKKTRSSTAV